MSWFDDNLKYHIDTTNIFAKETNKLQLLISLINKNTSENCFKDYCVEAVDIIKQCYQNDSTDIEDMTDLIILIDNQIQELFISEEHINKFNELIFLRKKVKKMAHKKFREGYDWVHSDEIAKENIKPIIKYPDEKPRNFWNVEECELQYYELCNYVWKQGLDKLKDLLDRK